MAGGRRKFATAHAYGKKRKRRSRIPKAASSGSTATSSATCASGCTTSTEAAAAQAMPVANGTSRTMRIDTLLVSEAEKVAIEHRAEEQRQKLSSLSATRQKQSLIGDSPEAAGCGTEFTLLSLPLLNQLLRTATHDTVIETAVAEAVARFNAGKKRASEAILKELHLSQGSTDVERCLEKDQRRLAACDKKHTRAENFRNAMKRRRVKENDRDYVPGGF
ncbi:hypothetical protein HPB52_004116 [Rhipicephalus sanguineus]|uniref:Uncharacterized protein n=1 Tax=Rhipicephalus sanguineus TaxID=34632 RepID=A0A9D4PE33_RHISA|nr:hypothetical protein HPB52_004116 [Rhipicephalus sanguineus]